MNLKASICRVETVIVAYAAWMSHDILWAWRNSPFDHAGAFAFLLWLVPPVRAAWGRPEPAPSVRWLTWTALAFALVGGILGINSLNYIALALALAGRWPVPGKSGWRWLLLSVAWMPVLGWFGSKGLPIWLVDAGRIALAILSIVVCLGLKGRK